MSVSSTGLYDVLGNPLSKEDALQILAGVPDVVSVVVEFVDKEGGRVTTVRHEFQPDVAGAIAGANILPAGAE